MFLCYTFFASLCLISSSVVCMNKQKEFERIWVKYIKTLPFDASEATINECVSKLHENEVSVRQAINIYLIRSREKKLRAIATEWDLSDDFPDKVTEYTMQSTTRNSRLCPIESPKFMIQTGNDITVHTVDEVRNTPGAPAFVAQILAENNINNTVCITMQPTLNGCLSKDLAIVSTNKILVRKSTHFEQFVSLSISPLLHSLSPKAQEGLFTREVCGILASHALEEKSIVHRLIHEKNPSLTPGFIFSRHTWQSFEQYHRRAATLRSAAQEIENARTINYLLYELREMVHNKASSLYGHPYYQSTDLTETNEYRTLSTLYKNTLIIYRLLDAEKELLQKAVHGANQNT